MVVQQTHTGSHNEDPHFTNKFPRDVFNSERPVGKYLNNTTWFYCEEY